MACKGIRKPRHMSVGGILTSTAASALVGLGAGVLGHINENKQKGEQERLLAERERIRSQASFAAGLEVQPANVPLLPMGGMIPYGNETVELENGEPFMSPDGQINSIPTNAPTHAQGGVPITLPNGTQVLGKLKNTEGKQFKEMGRKLEKAQSKYIKALENNPTNIAAKTSELMLKNIQNEFNDLFVEQEELKDFKKGGKTMPYGGLLPYPEGGSVTTQYGTSTPYYRNITPTTFRQQLLRKNILQPGYDTLSVPQINEQIRQGYNIPEGYALPYKVIEQDGNTTYQKDFGRRSGEFYDSEGTGKVIDTYNEPRVKFAKGGVIRKGFEGLEADGEPLEGINVGYTFDVGQAAYTAPTTQQYTNLAGTTPTDTIPRADEMILPKKGFNFNLPDNALGTIGSLAPVAYNVIQGMGGAEQQDPRDFYNPYEEGARSLMRQRRYNIQPELEQNRLAQATYQRGLREAAPSQAQYLGGLQAGAIGRSRADAAAIARAQNINNQYLADQAQMDAQFGAQRAATDFQVDTANMQNRAAARNLVGTGLGQLGQFAQNRQLMNNQILRDAQRLGLLEDLVANYEFADGKWRFKTTGEEQTYEDMMNYIKGKQ